MSAEPSSDLEAWLRLILAPGIGPRRSRGLVEACGSARSIFEATPGHLLQVDGMGQAGIGKLLDPGLQAQALEQIEIAANLGAEILTLDAPDYPLAIRRLENPPPVLFVLGGLIMRDRLAVSVVGPRVPSSYGRLMTRALVPPLCSRGITIVSGLAPGIDSEAHATALECDGRTIAVLAHGLDQKLGSGPRQTMATRIAREDRGAVVSIFPFGTPAHRGNFPQRNEIVAAFSLGTLVIEAGRRSGALITARHAGDQGRTVMACPGDANRPGALGSNALIADGAALIQRSDDILEALAPDLAAARAEIGIPAALEPEADSPPEAAPSDALSRDDSTPAPDAVVPGASLAARILGLLDSEHRPIDLLLELCAQAGHTQGEIVEQLLKLELAGKIQQLPGRVYCKAM